MLRLLARIKLARLLAEPLDLRAHCILQVEDRAAVPAELQDAETLLSTLQQRLQDCQQQGLLQDPPITEFQLTIGAAKAKAGKAKAAAVATDDTDGEAE